jgi:GT2 family glycosyltransferase
MSDPFDPRILRMFDIKGLGETIYENRGAGDAEIVVVIPLYNYAHTITEALGSVVKQDLPALAVIVVDDCSTDDGGQRAVDFLKCHPARFSRAQVVRHHCNQGLAMSRNSGIVHSTEPYLFMLDADNRLRPPALSRLLDALNFSGADFAYSQLRMFGDEEGIGDGDVWEPSRLAIGNYIDAMALLRRAALLAAGGYADMAGDPGWEDYDLWCRFAGLGFHGVFLPELLCEYRVHSSSMLRTRTNFKSKALSAEMALRHPTLFARSRADAPAAGGATQARRGTGRSFFLDGEDETTASAMQADTVAERDPPDPPIVADAPLSLRADPSWNDLEPLLRDLLDPDWYLSRNPDLMQAGVDPFEHFVMHGAQEPRDPCGDFDSIFYLDTHRHLIGNGQSPISHYLLHGRKAGLSPKLYHLLDFAIDIDHQLASARPRTTRRICCLVHAHHIDLVPELLEYVENIGLDHDVFVNLVDDTWTLDHHRYTIERIPDATVVISSDVGRDIGGFLRLLMHVDFLAYDLFLFVHSKRSPHLPAGAGDIWRRNLLDPIVGTPDKARRCIEVMRANPGIGITAAARQRATKNRFGNSEKYTELLDRASISPAARDCEFVAGTMFLMRVEVVRRLYNLLRQIPFEDGSGRDIAFHAEGQYAHAVERLIGNLVKDEGLVFRWV